MGWDGSPRMSLGWSLFIWSVLILFSYCQTFGQLQAWYYLWGNVFSLEAFDRSLSFHALKALTRVSQFFYIYRPIRSTFHLALVQFRHFAFLMR